VTTLKLLHAAGVSVLFTRSDSCYIDLVADCWDIQRDARGYKGPNPVVCHPPCRGWGRLRHWAKPRPDEKALGLFAVDCVRKYGGVLEHPYGSTLWPAAGLPKPGFKPDAWGGWTLLVEQGWFGHAAPKPTYLYIVGLSRADIGDLPFQLHRAAGRTLELSPADRERTPPKFAKFLLSIAARSVTRAQVLVTSAGRNDSYTDQAKRAAAKRAAFSAWAASGGVV
jgi:hypothetical protein